MNKLPEPYELFNVYDGRLADLEKEWEYERDNSTCEDCAHCKIANEDAMQPLVKYVIKTIRTLYDKKPNVTRTDENIEYDFSRACSNARLYCAYCTEHQEFIDAEESAKGCDFFSC